MNYLLLFLLFIGIIIHRYLTVYDEMGVLPYRYGFIIFLWIFYFGSILSLLWMFGIRIGILIFLLFFFQILNAAFFWVFQLPGTYKMNRYIGMYGELPPINEWIYGSWSILSVLLLVLSLLNILTSNYLSFYNANIKSHIDGTSIMILIAVAGAGNIVRVYTLKRILKDLN